MKKTIYLFIFALLIPSIGLCQNGHDTLEFYPLTFVDNISDTEAKQLQKVDSLDKMDYFFIENFKGDYSCYR
jgi:hypothetical protein